MTGSIDHDAAAAMRNAIDVVEEAYEFMLAYAAQGRKREIENEGVSKVRQYLNRFAGALDEMQEVVPAVFVTDTSQPFRDRFLDNMAVARSVITLLLDRPSITSDMVDNTNGLIALRAFLTDLFFIDQAILPARQGGEGVT